MEFAKSFLSRIFKTKPGEPEEQKHLEVEDLVIVQQEAEVKPYHKHELEMPSDHAFHKLYDLYSEQTGWSSPPQLVLEGPFDPPLSEPVGQAELRRLQVHVNNCANERLKLLQTQKKDVGEDGKTSLPDLDAHATVFLSKDNLTAWVLVYPPVGEGKELDQGELSKALQQEQISYGLDQTLLGVLPQNPERYFKLFPVACGVAAVNGKDGCIEDLFPRAEKKTLAIGENDQADYRNLGFIHNVEQGGVICRIIPPTEGTPGRTVQDQEVPAKTGKAATPPKGKNTELSEDGLSLVSTIAGHVEFISRSFQVKPVLDIPGNVDFSVGNINFLGDITIRGDVRSGFSVKATGTITIEGVVENCNLDAGRDLVIARGIQGDSEAIIRAQNNIFAKFLENSCVYAKGNIEADAIVNCEVYCGGTVRARTGFSKINGGKIHAAHKVSAGIVGSRVGGRTEIVLGGHPCEEYDCNVLTKEIQEIENTMNRVKLQPNSSKKENQLARLRVQMLGSQHKLETAQKDRELQLTDEQSSGPRRMDCGTVFPGTILTISEVVHHFRDMLSPCSATLKNGEIQVI